MTTFLGMENRPGFFESLVFVVILIKVYMKWLPMSIGQKFIDKLDFDLYYFCRICLMLPWNNPRYYDNSDGLFDFMPIEHRPDGARFLHDDWPYPFSKIPRTWTSFIFEWAELLEGDPRNYVHNRTLEQRVSITKDEDTEQVWLPKPWGLPGTYQKTLITFRDPVTREEMEGIYRSRVYLNGLGWRIGPRFSDDVIDGIESFYVNWVPLKSLAFLTFGTKKITNED